MADRVKFAPCSRKQQQVLKDNKTDVLLVGGGAGGSKSFACLLKALEYVKDPKARVLIIRETYPILKLPGGLVDESKSIYGHFGAKFGLQSLTWTFPNGATIKFMAIPDNLREWQGLQATNILIDEACPSFTQEQVLFLMSRLRGANYKGHLNLVMTCNPDRNSFLFDWVQYCLDPDTGVPKAGTEDITRWFVNVGGKILWGSSVQSLFEEHGHGMTLGKDFRPLSFRFIPLTVYDNPILLKNNPTYLNNLLGQPRVNQLRYLHGSWTAIDTNNGFFKRDWVEIVDSPPANPIAKIRSWDLAASVPSETNPKVDWTSGTLMSRDREGYYYIEDVYRFQKLSDGVLKEIVKTSIDQDGDEIPISIPKDPGAAGKVANQYQVSYLIENGIRTVKTINTSGGSSKLNKFKPFSSMAENRKIRVVRGKWNEDFFTELEYFDGGRQGNDDQVDSTSDAFNTLCRQIQVPSFTMPTLSQPSIVPRI